MRRAAVQAFRSARRPVLRKAFRHRTPLALPPSHILGQRSLSSRRDAQVLRSSMHIRTFSVALVGAAVASGAWYYRTAQQHQAKESSTFATPQAGNTPLTASDVYSNSAVAGPSHSTAKEAAASTRRAL